MWRVNLSLITHRFLILVVALSALHFQESSQSDSLTLTWTHFIEKISASKEATELSSLSSDYLGAMFSKTKDPFLWLGNIITHIFHWSPETTILILSNLFLLLFLWELNLLVNSMALPDVAVDTCLLVILWLTSYELSLGSSLSLSCFLSVLTLRSANDRRWFICGLSLATLALTKPFALFLFVPIIISLLGHLKYVSSGEFGLTSCLLVLPTALAVFYNWDLYSNLGLLIQDSAFMSLTTLARPHPDLAWPFSQSYLGQTIALIILFFGTVVCFFVFSTFLHRILPLVLFLAILFTTPYRELATSTLLVAPAFSGIAELCTTGLLRVVQLLFLIFGAIEVFNLF